MIARSGLRLRMAVSYVVVSAAAVLVVEVVLLTLVAPALRDASTSLQQATGRADRADVVAAQSKARLSAFENAAALSVTAERLAEERPGASDADLLAALGRAGLAGTPFARSDRGGGVTDVSMLLVAPDGRIVATAGGGGFRVGSVFHTPSAAGDVIWANNAVTVAAGTRTPQPRVVGTVYVGLPTKFADGADKPGPVVERDRSGSVRERVDGAAPDGKDAVGSDKTAGTVAPASGVGTVLVPGLVVLGLLVPVGLLFGLLSTGPLIRRVRRLAERTATMADGDLGARIPVSGDDEIGRLERGFNAMAERLEAAVRHERDAAAGDARRAERTRIARELHDSVSQHLFSLNLLAGGLRRALPEGSPLRHQAESMERTVDRTMREMRAMLLELRPVSLEDAGLVAALTELCRAYEARLGIRVSADVGELRADPAVEHAVLRVAQEALSNAARHGQADRIELSVEEVAGHVVVAIRDHGCGFEPAQAAERHGLGLALMRERVAELGGTLDVASAPERGTTVRAEIPVGAAGGAA